MGIEYAGTIFLFLADEDGFDELSFAVGDAEGGAVDFVVDHEKIFEGFLAVVVPAVFEQFACEVGN